MARVLALAAVYLLMSLCTYAVYAADKRAAQQGRQRVPERTLHLLALLGGWPGAWLAQRRLRHKTRKTGFLLVFWLTVLGHLGAIFTEACVR
ncbi:MAG: DUF1294 domain-containing protein [Curvibacter sp.]